MSGRTKPGKNPTKSVPVSTPFSNRNLRSYLDIRNREFKTPKEMQQAFFDYTEEVCRPTKELPTHAGFAAYCGMGKAKLSRYRGYSEDFEEVYNFITAVVENEWLQEASLTPYMSNVMQTYLNNNCGYTYGKQEIDTKVDLKADLSKLSVQQLAKQVQAFIENHKDDDDLIKELESKDKLSISD